MAQRDYELPWATTTAATRLVLPMSCEDTLCIHFRTPPGLAPNPGWIAMAQKDAAPSWRWGVISWGRGDFNGELGTGRYTASTGMSLNWNITVGNDPIPGSWTCVCAPDHDFYINVRNTDQWGNVQCQPGQNCEMFLDLRVPT